MKVVHLLRKPCSEGTVAANVLRWGTGALNIDATRVAHANPTDLDAHRKMVEAIKARGGSMANSWANSSDLSGANEVSAGGRWPANLVLQHLSACEQTGTREEAGYTVNRFTDGMKPFGEGAGHPYESEQVPPSTVPVWACGAGCPVAGLDAQSLAGGMHSAGTTRPAGLSVMSSESAGMFGLGGHSSNGMRFGDTGGASRFFKQVGGKVRGEE
jgi:hypothetical protein